MKSVWVLSPFLMLAACGPAAEAPVPSAETASVPSVSATEPESSDDGEVASVAAEAQGSGYWGVEPGEPLPINWDDLMPEGALEEYFRQQEEFYAEFERRMQANAVRLSDAGNTPDIEEGSDLDYMPQFGTFDTVDDIDGTLIRIPGYVVPFDFEAEGRHSEFLFVPSQGACIHTPPPPPNQVIYVQAAEAVAVDDIWVPYWLEGTISVERNENNVGNAAYTLSLTDLRPYPIPR